MFKVPNQAFWRQWATLPLRLIIGYGFMAHGWAKLSRGPAGFARLLEQIGAPLPEVTAWVSTLIELLGGLAILAGAFVAAVSIPLIVMMLVAMFTVHLRYGFSAINTIGLTADGPQFGPPGYEVNLLYNRRPARADPGRRRPFFDRQIARTNRGWRLIWSTIEAPTPTVIVYFTAKRVSRRSPRFCCSMASPPRPTCSAT